MLKRGARVTHWSQPGIATVVWVGDDMCDIEYPDGRGYIRVPQHMAPVVRPTDCQGCGWEAGHDNGCPLKETNRLRVGDYAKFGVNRTVGKIVFADDTTFILETEGGLRTRVDQDTVTPFDPPGFKADAGKPRWELLPLDPIEMVVRVLTFGASKYSDDGWRKVENAKERYFGALLRHIFAFRRGEWLDPESGLPHIAHALCNLVILYELHKDSDALGTDVRSGKSEPEAGGEE